MLIGNQLLDVEGLYGLKPTIGAADWVRHHERYTIALHAIEEILGAHGIDARILKGREPYKGSSPPPIEITLLCEEFERRLMQIEARLIELAEFPPDYEGENLDPYFQ